MTGTVPDRVDKISVEDIDDAQCPCCGTPFNPDEWDDVSGYYYVREGGVTQFACPTDDCPGGIDMYT